MRMSKGTGLAILACAAWGLPAATAQVTHWAAPVSGAFDDPARWTNGAPAGGSHASVAASGDYVVTVGAPVSGLASFTLAAELATLRTDLPGTVSSSGTFITAGTFSVDRGRWNGGSTTLRDSARLLVQGGAYFGGMLTLSRTAPDAGTTRVRVTSGTLSASINPGQNADFHLEVAGGTVSSVSAISVTTFSTRGTVSVTGGTLQAPFVLRNPAALLEQSGGSISFFGTPANAEVGLGLARFTGGSLSIPEDLRVSPSTGDRGVVEIGGNASITLGRGFRLMPEGSPILTPVSATVTQTGGSVRAQFVEVWRAGAHYLLSGGTLNPTTGISVGGRLDASGNAQITTTDLSLRDGGTFTQSGDARTSFARWVEAGTFGGDPSGLLDLRAGVLSSGRIFLASRNSVVRHSGGLLTLGPAASRFNGREWLQTGGEARISALTLQGTFVQTGGVTSVADAMAGVGTLQAFGSVTVSDSALLTAGRVSVASLTVGSRVDLRPSAVETTASAVGSLSITHDGAPFGSRTYSGYLDLWAGGLVVRAGDLAALRDAVAAARQGRGGGIGSALAGLDNPQDRFATVGVRAAGALPGIPALTRFGNFDVGPTDVLLRYTYFGDVDLNGVLDTTDFNVLQARLAAGISTGANWSDGDSDYDGDVDSADWWRFLTAYQAQLPPMTWGRAIPEPALVGAIPLAGQALGRRRRR